MNLFSLFPLAVYGQAAASALSWPAMAVLHLLHAAAELLNGDNGSQNLFHNGALHDSALRAPLAFLPAAKGIS